jgi:hypothetical protein
MFWTGDNSGEFESAFLGTLGVSPEPMSAACRRNGGIWDDVKGCAYTPKDTRLLDCRSTPVPFCPPGTYLQQRYLECGHDCKEIPKAPQNGQMAKCTKQMPPTCPPGYTLGGPCKDLCVTTSGPTPVTPPDPNIPRRQDPTSCPSGYELRPRPLTDEQEKWYATNSIQMGIDTGMYCAPVDSKPTSPTIDNKPIPPVVTPKGPVADSQKPLTMSVGSKAVEWASTSSGTLILLGAAAFLIWQIARTPKG